MSGEPMTQQTLERLLPAVIKGIQILWSGPGKGAARVWPYRIVEVRRFLKAETGVRFSVGSLYGLVI